MNYRSHVASDEVSGLARKAGGQLRERVLRSLLTNRPAVGTKFATDAELAESSGLSHSTVRRVLRQLHREGWLERRLGHGSYVGPRVAISSPAESSLSPAPLAASVRLAVLVQAFGNPAGDWYSRYVLDGIDRAAAGLGLSIELLGDRDADPDLIRQRLIQGRPNVLACLAPRPHHSFIFGEARRLGIHCIGTGTRFGELGLPCACEDGRQGALLAVRHLVEQGHRRIGLLMPEITAPLVWHRRQGYVDGLTEAGIEVDHNLVQWLDENPTSASYPEAIRVYLNQQRPTAVICGTSWPMDAIGKLVAAGEIAVPRDLSVVSFDQYTDAAYWLGGQQPTTIALPLREMGQQLARFARDAAAGQFKGNVVYLPCQLLPGASVARVS